MISRRRARIDDRGSNPSENPDLRIHNNPPNIVDHYLHKDTTSKYVEE